MLNLSSTARILIAFNCGPLRPLVRFSTKIKHQENVDFSINKRPVRPKKAKVDLAKFTVKAFATASEYNLERLIDSLNAKDEFQPKVFESVPNVCYSTFSKDLSDKEKRELFFFREGSVVLWNIPEPEVEYILDFIKSCQIQPYNNSLVLYESEMLNYKYMLEEGKNSSLHKLNGEIFLAPNGNDFLDKYTFSNAMALSVKLGIWESFLDHFIDSIESVTEDLKRGSKIRMTRDEVLRKQGELFSLRHAVNLSSDLIDTPNFYWEEEELERLYIKTCQYFSISKRTYVMNQRLNHCLELVELLSSNLNDKHHVRLEWMIILLITVEVIFELMHYVKPSGKNVAEA